MDQEEGWDRRGLNKEASGVGGPANHLPPPRGHRVRTIQTLPWLCPTSARHPSLRGPAEKGDGTCPLTTQERIPLGREQRSASEGTSGQRLLPGPHLRLERDWKRMLRTSVCSSPGTQRFPWTLLLPGTSGIRAPGTPSAGPHLASAFSPGRATQGTPPRNSMRPPASARCTAAV